MLKMYKHKFIAILYIFSPFLKGVAEGQGIFFIFLKLTTPSLLRSTPPIRGEILTVFSLPDRGGPSRFIGRGRGCRN
jgi:hypothetical protein